jgi:uncharacterized membrane-anchored protein
MTHLAVKLAAVAATQLALVGVAVAPQLSARLTGEEYRLRVQPVDPIDPFRGAYVDLGYPDLQPRDEFEANELGDPGEGGRLYITLEREGEVWRASGYSRTRPDDQPYLACDDRDFRIRCGIESWFLPQDEAAQMQDRLAGGDLVAVVTVDGRGNAALVRVETD